MNFIITYNPDGSIISSSKGTATLTEVIQGSGELAVEVDAIYDPNLYYVDLTTLTPVPKTAITGSTAITTSTNVAATLSGLPDCNVEYYARNVVEDELNIFPELLGTDTVTDGQLSVSSDLAGEYIIALSAPTFLDTTVVLTVEDT